MLFTACMCCAVVAAVEAGGLSLYQCRAVLLKCHVQFRVIPG